MRGCGEGVGADSRDKTRDPVRRWYCSQIALRGSGRRQHQVSKTNPMRVATHLDVSMLEYHNSVVRDSSECWSAGLVPE